MSVIMQQWQKEFADAVEETGEILKKPVLRLRRDALLKFCQAARAKGFDYLACMTGVDRPEERVLEVIYNLYSYQQRQHLVLKTRCPYDDPKVSSVSSIWKAALFLERETFDLVGIKFEGHPDLQRILLPESWQGHPLRKDYPMEREQFVSKDAQGRDVVSFEPTEGW